MMYKFGYTHDEDKVILTKQIIVRLSEADFKALGTVAESMGRNKSEVIRMLIQTAIKNIT